MKPIRLKVCPLCGDINQYGYACDNASAHPGEAPDLVEEVFYPLSLILQRARSYYDDCVEQGSIEEGSGGLWFVECLTGVDPDSENGLPSVAR